MLNDSRLLGILSLNHSTGWIEGPAGELLMWIPYEHRSQLLLPGVQLIIGSHPTTIGLHDFCHGESWSRCQGEAAM
jgi:hypothetical protein